MTEPLSPELALVDPDLAARARAALPSSPPVAARPSRPSGPPTPPVPVVPPSAPSDEARQRHPYPMWARVTAAMWFVVLGILIGGAAIPHAQDTPRLIPKSDVPSSCNRETTTPAPLGPEPIQPGR